MSLLYKDEKEIIYSVDIEQKKGNLKMLFYCDCGKFGTDEFLDEIEISVNELLELLQKIKKDE